MKTQVQRNVLFSILFAAVIGTGCSRGTTDVAVSSAPVAFTGATSLNAWEASSALTDTSSFKFCVKRVRLEQEDGSAVTEDKSGGTSGDDSEYIQFTPGLITVADNQEVNWGTMTIPTGFKLKRIKIKLQKSPDNCSGANYSVEYNGVTSTEDIEFRFRFEPALELDDATGALQLSLADVVSALRNAASIDASKLKQYIDAAEGSASRK